jgi:hypothetical protein
MRTPSVPEVILEMLFAQAIDLEAAKKYLLNYQFFEANRARIEQRQSGRWAASLNRRILAADTREGLEQQLAGKPDANRAYIEHVGGGI